VQIAEMNWTGLGYTPLHGWHSGTVAVQDELKYTVGSYETYEDNIGPGEPRTMERYVESERMVSTTQRVPVYSRWYLAYLLIPQGDTKTTNRGVRKYAQQGFRCAIHMRDFPAARRHWALFARHSPSNTSPSPAPLNPRDVLLSLFLNDHLKIDSAAYLSIPRDIRSDVWNSAKTYYSYDKNKWPSLQKLTIEQVETAAQAGKLEETITYPDDMDQARFLPRDSVLYCPAFYPDFDPSTIPDYNPEFFMKASVLRKAAEKEASKGQ
jgi:hypothetical protein